MSNEHRGGPRWVLELGEGADEISRRLKTDLQSISRKIRTLWPRIQGKRELYKRYMVNVFWMPQRGHEKNKPHIELIWFNNKMGREAWARVVSAYLTLPLSDRLECTRDLNGRWGGRNSGYKKLSEFACLKNNRTTAREEECIKLALGNGRDNLNQYPGHLLSVCYIFKHCARHWVLDSKNYPFLPARSAACSRLKKS